MYNELITTVPNDRKTCFVNVDTYINKQPVGTIYNPYHKCSKAYGSLMELIQLMEQLFDELLGDSDEVERRSFHKNAQPQEALWDKTESVDTKESGKLATFKIDVLFRRRASWQGVICWMDENREECFRSTLEMLQLLDSALVPVPVRAHAAK